VVAWRNIIATEYTELRRKSRVIVYILLATNWVPKVAFQREKRKKGEEVRLIPLEKEKSPDKAVDIL
jgi:hypothetical protein